MKKYIWIVLLLTAANANAQVVLSSVTAQISYSGATDPTPTTVPVMVSPADPMYAHRVKALELLKLLQAGTITPAQQANLILLLGILIAASPQ